MLGRHTGSIHVAGQCDDATYQARGAGLAQRLLVGRYNPQAGHAAALQEIAQRRRGGDQRGAVLVHIGDDQIHRCLEHLRPLDRTTAVDCAAALDARQCLIDPLARVLPVDRHERQPDGLQEWLIQANDRCAAQLAEPRFLPGGAQPQVLG